MDQRVAVLCQETVQLTIQLLTLAQKVYLTSLLAVSSEHDTCTWCRAEEVLVTTEVDVPAKVMEITKGRGAWAAINPIGGPASRDLPSCKLCSL